MQTVGKFHQLPSTAMLYIICDAHLLVSVSKLWERLLDLPLEHPTIFIKKKTYIAAFIENGIFCFCSILQSPKKTSAEDFHFCFCFCSMRQPGLTKRICFIIQKTTFYCHENTTISQIKSQKKNSYSQLSS